MVNNKDIVSQRDIINMVFVTGNRTDEFDCLWGNAWWMVTQQSPNGAWWTLLNRPYKSCCHNFIHQLTVTDRVRRCWAVCAPTIWPGNSLHTASVTGTQPLWRICRFIDSLKPFYITPLRSLCSRGMLILKSVGPCTGLPCTAMANVTASEFVRL